MDETIVNFTRAHETMLTDTVAKTQIHSAEIERLMQYRDECDLLHEHARDKNKRMDDAMNNLTNSTLLLAKTIVESTETNTQLANKLSDINITINKLVEENKINAPAIDTWKSIITWFKVNKVVLSALFFLAAGIASIITLYSMVS